MNTFRTFISGLVVLFSITVLHGAQLSQPSSPTGTWEGKLNVSTVNLRLVLHIAETNGMLTATMDSPDQGTRGMVVNDVIVRNDSLLFTVVSVQGRYAGAISSDGTTIDGQWSQGPVSMPLSLRRANGLQEPSRHAQEPVKPYPYTAEDVTFSNTAAGNTLAGTLTMPSSGGPFPAVILISGSGPQNRDGMILGHKPFLVLADALTRRGIAVLRFDDRGFGQSTGSFAKATTQDFATDVQAGIQYLQSRPDIDARRIGLIGHSEGGLVAPMVAVQSSNVAFLVLLAAPGFTGETILQQQAALINRGSGKSEAFINANTALQQRMFAAVKKSEDTTELRKNLETAFAEATPAERQLIQEAEITVDKEMGPLSSPWLRFFLTYDPIPALKQIRVPVLAITGSKDVQVPPKENLAAIGKALKEGKNAAVTVQELPGLNHLFQTTTTGLPSEYGSLEETFSPDALQLIGSWIEKQTRKK